MASAAPPVVFEAGQLSQSSNLPLLEDWAPTFEGPSHNATRVYKPFAAVALRPSDQSAIELDLGELPVGMYHLDLDARWDREVAADQRNETQRGPAERLRGEYIERVRQPVYLHLAINDGRDGASNDYRQLVLYHDDYQRTARLFFHVDRPRRIQARLYLGEGSRAGLRVRSVTLIDSFDGMSRTRSKRNVLTFTPAQRERQRLEANDGQLPDVNDSTMAPEARRERDALIWHALPRLNTQVYRPHGGETTRYSGPDALMFPGINKPHPELAVLKDHELFRDLGVWQLEGVDHETKNHSRAYNRAIEPLTLVHRPSGETMSMEQIYAHQPLPARPFIETEAGAFFPAEQVGELGRNHQVFTVGELMFFRYLQFYHALLPNDDRNSGLKLPQRYHLTGDRAAARDAAMMLVRMAQQWPALQLMWQDLGQMAANPNLDYNVNTRGGWKDGKLYYRGWSGGTFQDLLLAYEYLYDFIDGNEEFASAVHQHLPFVETPDDVIAFLDTYLVRTGIRDMRDGRIGGDTSVMALAAMVLGDGSEASEVLNLSRSRSDIYPFKDQPWIDLYASAFNRDGTHYIGSWSYARGMAHSLLELAHRQKVLREHGAAFQFDFSDIKRWPKVAAAAESLLDARLAGGYFLAVGDASGSIWTGRQSLNPEDMDGTFAYRVWQLTGDARYAWLVVNAFGREGQDDQTWQTLTDAAATVRDPRLHQRSRVLGGFGAAILESGTDFRDYRLKQAVVLRTGSGQGHAHDDALDLNIFALGARMATDTATRSEGQLWSEPPSKVSMVHNVVEVDGKHHPWRAEGDWPPGSFARAEAWIEAFKPLSGAKYMVGQAASGSHPDVELFRREVAHIEAAPGRESATPLPEQITLKTEHPNDIELPRSYIFDVFRVAGGRWHTWTFHGAVSDEFTVNAPLKELGDDASAADEAERWSRHYLRKLHAPAAGEAGEVVEATWRLSRVDREVTAQRGGEPVRITARAGEPAMLGVDYDPDAPRRYTRIALLGQQGAHVLRGSPFSEAYQYCFPFLYVQHRGEEKGRQSVFPTIIEAYAGEPTVTGRRLLNIANNETDALQAVAVEVTTRNGHTDVLYSGGRPDRLRQIDGGIRAAARFAYLSRDDKGLRQATLVGGAQLQAPGISIRVNQDHYVGQIVNVDYAARQATLSVPLPDSLVGEELLIYNDDHRTSYTIEAIENRGRTCVVTFTRTALIGRSEITAVNADKRTVTVRQVAFQSQGTANRGVGWTIANESHTQHWKQTDTRQQTYTVNGPVNEAQFDDADRDGRHCVELFDYGPGDRFELPVHVSVRRTAEGSYDVQANVTAQVQIDGQRVSTEPTAAPWRE